MVELHHHFTHSVKYVARKFRNYNFRSLNPLRSGSSYRGQYEVSANVESDAYDHDIDIETTMEADNDSNSSRYDLCRGKTSDIAAHVALEESAVELKYAGGLLEETKPEVTRRNTIMCRRLCKFKTR